MQFFQYPTVASELIVGDRVWVAGGVIKMITDIESLGGDLYHLWYGDGTSDRNIPGDILFDLAELHEGIDY